MKPTSSTLVAQVLCALCALLFVSLPLAAAPQKGTAKAVPGGTPKVDPRVGGQLDRTTDTSEMQVIPTLEVQQLSGDLRQWGRELVLYEPRPLLFRWGKPISSDHFDWQVYEGSIGDSGLFYSGSSRARPDPDKMHVFKIDMGGILPESPPENGRVYTVRVVPQGEGLVPSEEVVLRYQRDTSETRFSFQGLYPEFFRPMPVRVNLHTLLIEKADEEDDEEPYLLPIVAYIDGTTINIEDLAGSRVRVETSKRGGEHGNLPLTNDLGSGDKVPIPADVGYFEKTILPINIEKAETLKPLCDPSQDPEGCVIHLADLTRATTVWIMVIAFEEDANDDSVAIAVRDAITAGLRRELSRCVSTMTLAEALALFNNELDVEDTLSTHDEVTFCNRTATEDETILDQIRDSLTAMGKSAAKEDIFLSAWSFLHGGVLNLFDDVIDPDDYIGFDWFTVTYDELMRSPGAIRFTLTFDKADNSGPEEAGVHPVRYEISGSVGRCEKVPGRERCRGVSKPLLDDFP